MKHLEKTKTPKKKVVLIANVEKDGCYYFCDDMVYRLEYMHPLYVGFDPSMCIFCLLLVFMMLTYGAGSDYLYFLFIDVIFVALCALSLWLSRRSSRKLIAGAEKIDPKNMDEKTAYKIKWLAGLGTGLHYFAAEREYGFSLVMSVLLFIIAVFHVADADIKEVYPLIILLLEMWLYLKIFMQKRAAKDCTRRLMEFFNEYKANEAKRETDKYVEWDEDVFTGFGERL